MGACYAVDLTAKFKSEAEAAKALKAYIERNPLDANFSLEEWAKCGVGTESLDDLLTIMLAGWPHQEVHKEAENDGFTAYKNWFDASYGWQLVMVGMFRALAPTLEDGSEFFIGADNDESTYRIEDGEVV